MLIRSLGYVGLRGGELDDWVRLGTGLLGLQLTERSRSSLTFRMDDRKQRVMVGDDAFYGWEVADADALDTLAARLEVRGIRFARGDAALAGRRRVADLLLFDDPAGNRLEAFHGAECTTEPFRPGRAISGFATGPLGLGHAVLLVEQVAPALHFYREVLGFGLSDFMTSPFAAYFLHTNPRHHSLALIGSGRNAVHHLMLELFSLDDVGQAYDLAREEEGRIATTLGRHTNDYMTSFYARTPSDMFIEYGWGGRAIDPAAWQPHEMHEGPSLWGHDRDWLPPAGRQAARDLRLRAAAEGRRAAVQVMAGNHRLSPGLCAWWDASSSG